ncbi:MAG TPA: hypothetical protein VFV33_10630 [Gemmatimonadaceae bacterium]|nr:hypothetical protein [Gemmatimonadaceae bacterium]
MYYPVTDYLGKPVLLLNLGGERLGYDELRQLRRGAGRGRARGDPRLVRVGRVRAAHRAFGSRVHSTTTRSDTSSSHLAVFGGVTGNVALRFGAPELRADDLSPLPSTRWGRTDVWPGAVVGIRI